MTLDDKVDVGGGVDGQEIEPDAIQSIADHVVEDASELLRAFRELEAGDIVSIAQPATSYRPDEWLDVDVDDVTIVAESRRAEDGELLIKPADGSDVGGIRIGNSSPASGVTIHGIGYDGNESTMDDTVKNLDAIKLVDGGDLEVRYCELAWTHPWHEHNSGGSGVSIDTDADVSCHHNFVHDIGDRAFQHYGDGTFDVSNNLTRDGFDRSVSVQGPADVTIEGNRFLTLAEGSFIGIQTSSADGYVSISGNVGVGQHRGLCRVKSSGGRISITGNYARNTVDNFSPGVDVQTGTEGKVVITGNQFEGHNRGVVTDVAGADTVITGNRIENTDISGIRVASGSDVVISGNLIKGTNLTAGNDAIGVVGDGVAVTGNRIDDVGTDTNGANGIVVKGTDVGVVANVITGTSLRGIDVDSTAGAIVGNTLRTGYFGIDVAGSENLIGMNFVAGTGSASFYGSGTDNLYVGNRSDTATHWNLSDATTPRVMANWPNPPGYGYVVTTPDGSAEYELAVDNSGNITSTQL